MMLMPILTVLILIVLENLDVLPNGMTCVMQVQLLMPTVIPQLLWAMHVTQVNAPNTQMGMADVNANRITLHHVIQIHNC
jgi:hypothetical protein